MSSYEPPGRLLRVLVLRGRRCLRPASRRSPLVHRVVSIDEPGFSRQQARKAQRFPGFFVCDQGDAMRTTSVLLTGLILVVAVFTLPAAAAAQSLAGLWDATVVANRLDVPFRFEITGNGAAIKGSFFNGDEKVTSTSGS